MDEDERMEGMDGIGWDGMGVRLIMGELCLVLMSGLTRMGIKRIIMSIDTVMFMSGISCHVQCKLKLPVKYIPSCIVKYLYEQSRGVIP